jgi:hypothetical protein
MGMVVAILIFLFIAGSILIIRALSRHPNVHILWALAISFLIFLGLACLMRGESATFNSLALTSWVFAVLTAMVVEIAHDRLFRRELTYSVTIENVLHRNWFKVNP